MAHNTLRAWQGANAVKMFNRKDSPPCIAGKVLASAIGEHPRTVPGGAGCNRRLKGECHEIFCFWFFSSISIRPAPEYHIRTVSVPRMYALFFHRLSILERATDHECINDCSYSKKKCG